MVLGEPPTRPETPIPGKGWDGVMQERRGSILLRCGSGRCGVAAKLGVATAETVRKWVRRAEMDAGVRRGVISQDSAEVRKLRAEVRELRRANETSSRQRPVSSRPSLPLRHGDYCTRAAWMCSTACRSTRPSPVRSATGSSSSATGSAVAAACSVLLDTTMHLIQTPQTEFLPRRSD